jgi:hypothetical protein
MKTDYCINLRAAACQLKHSGAAKTKTHCRDFIFIHRGFVGFQTT